MTPAGTSAANACLAATLAGALLAMSAPAAWAEEAGARSHRIGVLAHRPKEQVRAGWQPLADALGHALPGCRFTIEVLDYQELEAAIAERRLDLVITNPGHYVGIRTRQPLSGVLATVIERGPGHPVAAFAGSILARADREDLRGLADLAGARIAAVGIASLGGYQAQAQELVQAGQAVPSPDRLQLTGMPHDKVVGLVLSGQADAGFVRAGTMEQMVAEGRLDGSKLKVLNRQEVPGFPYAVSTRLYPEWPVVTLSHVDEGEGRRIAAALLVMEHGAGGPAAAFHGFAIPADYSVVEALLRDLRLPPFEAAPVFGPADVLRRYLWPIALLVLAAVVILVLAAFLATSNRRLARARREADEAASTLALVLSTVTVGVARVRDRRLVWTSRHMEELFGYTAAELAGAGTRLLYPDDQAYLRTGQESLAALSEGRSYVTEQPMRHQDGTLAWTRMRGAPLRGSDGELEGIWTLEDVTDRRAVEEELRRALVANEVTTAELREALSSVKQLSGLLPICMYCHKIRTDQGYWDGLEGYISAHSEALFSHGICPTCLDSKFPDEG